MTIAEVLQKSRLERIDAEVLLAAILHRDRAWLAAHAEDELLATHMKQWGQWHDRRLHDEPVAYITGSREFYGRTFAVDRHVLIPRSSTEGLIDVALEFRRTGENITREVDSGIIAVAQSLGKKSQIKRLREAAGLALRQAQGALSERSESKGAGPAAGALQKGKDGSRKGTDKVPFRVIDIGTGSGCIAITLACALPKARIIATDSSREALKVAQANARTHGVEDRIHFLFGYLLEPLKEIDYPFLIVSNPPYIPDSAELHKEVRNYEPTSALFAGSDGLSVIRPLLEQAIEHPFCSGIVLECRTDQLSTISTLLNRAE